jgi:hypothetical protein
MVANRVQYRSNEEKMNIGSNKLMEHCKKRNGSSISGVSSGSIDVSSSSIIGNCNDDVVGLSLYVYQ